AGLLALDLPPGFTVPDPMGLRPGEDEDPLEDGDEAPEFAQDFLGDLERG
ncbi:MAG TPA: SMC-Scp complex subunit ScpB, partial [Caulobacter sp.]|nr:SMC-Scp complex subunit ScpB [Caulobacter sp.]